MYETMLAAALESESKVHHICDLTESERNRVDVRENLEERERERQKLLRVRCPLPALLIFPLPVSFYFARILSSFFFLLIFLFYNFT